MPLEPFSDAESRLSAIVASSDDAIISTDLDGTITSWNQAAERIFGFTEQEALAQSIHLVVSPALHAKEQDVLRRIRAGQEVDHDETTRCHKDGRRIDVSLTISPIRNAAGVIVGASTIARDVTLTKRLERHARHLAAIVESSDDAIVSKDLDGTVVSWNRAAERLFGYAAPEMIGRSIRVIVPPDRQTEEDHVLATVGRGEVVDHFETVRLRKDGSLVPISLTVSPIKNAAGGVIGASKIARDLTRIQRSQRDAIRLAAIVQSSDDAIISKDLNSIVTSWNGAAERMFGYAASEMVGKSIRLIIPDDRQYEEDDVLFKIRRGEPVEHYETVRRRKDGSLIPISLTVSPILDNDGVVVGASKIARDISDRTRAEEERQRLLVIARDASRMKDEFLATLSHELRTPLNAIVGYLRLLQAGLIGGEKQRRAIDTIARNAASLTQIVEDMLDVSRIISGKVRLNVQSVELSILILETVETTRPASDARGVRVETIVDPDVGPVSGDPERLRQILWNLMSNAVKFTDRGGHVQVRLARVDSHIELTVTDTGIGIPPEFVPHVFERFRQADAGVSRVYGGLGLGLAIARHLVELQGGHISVHSEGVGRGSTFRVELPLRSVPPIAAEPSDQRYAPAVDVHLEVPQLKGMKILVVDDDRDALALVREILEATGATVVTADSGMDALDRLRRSKPDLLIADLAMPNMDGFELIDQARRCEDLDIQRVPAVALTAFARSEDRARALRNGFQLHLSKPIDPAELMAAAAALGRRVRPSD